LLGAETEQVEALYDFGVDVGIAFQIHDDVLDLTADTETLGKGWGSDLIEEKKTLITLHALEQGIEPETIFPDSDTPDAIQAAVDALHESGSIANARGRAEALATRGCSKLNRLPPSKARSILDSLAAFLVTRES
jgi:geranylgeranyl diphosphate synthase type I